MKRKKLRRAAITTAALLAITIFSGCGGASPHRGRIPFSWMETPPRAPSGRTLATMDLVMEHREKDGPITAAQRQSLRPGDIIAFHMSHRDAWRHLRKGGIQKLPYDLFRYGHIALVVPVSDGSQTAPRLLQVAIRQAVNTDSDLDYLSEKSWHVFRPPSGSVDAEKLRQFTRQVTANASDPATAYDYSGILALKNAPSDPETLSEIGDEFSCATLVIAALHYSGYPLHAVHRKGLCDIVTPSQVVRGGAITPARTPQ